MKIDRLMSITIYLLKHGRTSATKLAEHFEVNPRTIIRDIDTLCQAGIPISSTYGVNGGYEILDTYVMDKQLVNHHDYKYIVSALKTMASAYESTKIQETIDKIEVLTKEKNAVIEMDLSVAHENTDTNEAIRILEGAIEQKRVVTFWYTNNENVSHQIKVEPVGVIYKWYNWYLVGYSLEHDDYRMYKLVRMENIVVTEEEISKEHSVEEAMKEKGDNQQITKIRAIGKACIKVKCREYLKIEIIKELNVVGRNADLVLQARIQDYNADILQALLYEEHFLVDGFDKEMCIYITKDYEKFSYVRQRAARSVEGTLRHNNHEMYIRRCYELAINAGKKGYDTFGAVLVSEGNIIAEAENTADYEKGIFGHAEFNLVHKCANKFSDKTLENATFYTSCAPCVRCLMAIASLGIKTIVFGVSYKSFQQLLPFEENIPNYEEILSKMNVSVKMIGPILEDEGMHTFEYWGGEYRPLEELIKEMDEIKERGRTMRSENYRNYFKSSFMMGPNCLRLLDEILGEYPLHYTSNNLVLDLGCGKGVTSLFIANETGATVYANDLWISEEENRKRFENWNMQDKLFPMQEDATDLHFDKEIFDALISIDSYHYFAGKEGFFANHILPYIKKGGIALIVIPGIKSEYDGRSEELLTTWAGDEAYMFQSAEFWKRIIGEHENIGEVRTWEMSLFDLAWQEWFDTKHKYALNDKKYFDSIIKPFTNFVGIMVRKK